MVVLQRRTVSYHVERAGNVSENSRWRHGQTPEGTGMHHRLPQQASRGGGEEEEREEEGGPRRQDREKRQQGDGRQKLAGLGEVSRAWIARHCLVVKKKVTKLPVLLFLTED